MNSAINNLSKSLACQQRGEKYIPGLTQLLSKRPDQFAPGVWPGYFEKAKGVEVWDLDGNRYIDMSISGIGAVILGCADPDVDGAVVEAIKKGTFCSLNCPEEVELAELLCSLHPWAQMVRYGRGGGEAMMIAVRIARAHTKKDKIAFCGYHGWHDWYLAANLGSGNENELEGHLLPGLKPLGVPRVLKGTAFPFHYNHISELEEIVAKNKDDLAAIVMEPIRHEKPRNNFLQDVRSLANKIGAILIFDEVSSGFRLTTGGAHLTLGVFPDMAVFAKGMSNGYPMGAVIGKEGVMKSAEDTFMSSTYWTDRIGPAASLACLRKHKEKNVSVHLVTIGTLIQEGWRTIARETGLTVTVAGIPPLSDFSFEDPQGLVMMTLFVQEMLKNGFLASNRFYANYAHTPEHVREYLQAAKEVFQFIKKALEEGDMERHLMGPAAKPGFHRLA